VSLALRRIAQLRAAALRLGFVISACSQRTEDGRELLGAVHDILRSAAVWAAWVTLRLARAGESYDSELAPLPGQPRPSDARQRRRSTSRSANGATRGQPAK
jgi:hypothetical protein